MQTGRSKGAVWKCPCSKREGTGTCPKGGSEGAVWKGLCPKKEGMARVPKVGAMAQSGSAHAARGMEGARVSLPCAHGQP